MLGQTQGSINIKHTKSVVSGMAILQNRCGTGLRFSEKNYV